MNDATITLVVSCYHAPAAVALMLESFQQQHAGLAYQVHACDNSGIDAPSGVWEYLIRDCPEHWHLTREGETLEHGASLDRLCLSVTTPYTLVVDSDVEFLAPVAQAMIGDMKYSPQATAVYLPDAEPAVTVEVWGKRLAVQPRVSPVLSLWRTERLQHLLENGATWASAFGRKKYWDTGGLLWVAANCALPYGPPLAPLHWLADRVAHFGEVTALWAEPGMLFPAPDLTEERRAAIGLRYAAIKERLAQLRAKVAEDIGRSESNRES